LIQSIVGQFRLLVKGSNAEKGIFTPSIRVLTDGQGSVKTRTWDILEWV